MRRPFVPVSPQESSLSAATAADEVVTICRDLIRIDSTNPGDDSGPGERAVAEHVAALLAEAGLEPDVFEAAPGRTSLVTRLPGADPTRPALVVHGHLDVVPALAQDWSVAPLSGEVRDGCVWGRGAVDMKGMDAIILAALRNLVRTGRRPARDLVVAFFADEEAGGTLGSGWLARHHPHLFEGATEAVSEVGGFSVDLAGRRAYLLQSAEKGIAWLRLVATGRAGHGSQVNGDNAITHLAQALARIGAHTWPIQVPTSVRAFFDGVREHTGVELLTKDGVDVEQLRELFGAMSRWIEATVQDTANPSVLTAGYKHNVIPGQATALLDCRFLPGNQEQLMATITELAGEHVQVQVVHSDIALEAPHATPLTAAMARALQAEDPGCLVLPYCLAGGTDNKSLRRLDIDGYGFAPLRLPPDLDFAGMFHGVDERVPVDALQFGTRTFERFLLDC